MTTTIDTKLESISTSATTSAPRLDIVEVSQHVKDHQTLHQVSFAVQPAEIVAIAGGSGSGKTTLLESMVGIRPASSGWVLIDGRELTEADRGSGFGYVPQDDIIHLDLPLRRTLEHAAALRMPANTSRDEIAVAVTSTLERLELSDRADVLVKSLSGGQRKRASIASELLNDPHLFLLDEPTSGLDPATSSAVMGQLRRLAQSGTTVVLTTHSPGDLAKCDRIAFLASDGHLAFVGSPSEALEYFDVEDLSEIYDVLAATEDPKELANKFTQSKQCSQTTSAPRSSWPREKNPRNKAKPAGAVRQWRALTRRNLDLVTASKLTLAILIGSPTMVIGMMAVLFRPGTFGVDQLSAIPAIQTLFWVAFASFFFGVTYGLLQVVGEFEIFKRERFSGLSIGAYVLSKMTVLTPLLVLVNVIMLGILRGLDRLPAASIQDWSSLLVSLVLVSGAAVSVGLLASSAVQNSAQATLALPMLCFPQVLFAGAVVPVAEMAGAGQFMSFGLAGRWGFESLGRTLGLGELAAENAATAGYSDAFAGSASSGWVVLVAIIAIALAGTHLTLNRRSK